MSGALGLAVLSTFATNHTSTLIAAGHPPQVALLSGYRLAYALGIASVLLGILVAVVLLRFRSAPGSEVAVEPAGGDEPRVIRSGSQDQDLGGDVAEQPGEVVLA